MSKRVDEPDPTEQSQTQTGSNVLRLSVDPCAPAVAALPVRAALHAYPAFSWSATRDRVTSCPRRYFYQYYLSNLGRAPNADPRARAAHALKMLTTLALRAGSILHQWASRCATAASSGACLPTEHEMFTHIQGELTNLRKASEETKSFLDDPKPDQMLQTVFYRMERGFAWEIEAIVRKLPRLVANLAGAELWKELRDRPAQLRLFSGFPKVDHPTLKIPVFGAPDLFVIRDSEFQIIDWKSGSAEGSRAQMRVYAWFLTRHLKLPFSFGSWSGRVISLLDGSEDQFSIVASDLEATEIYIAESVAYMRSFLRDVGTNTPKDEAAFPYAEAAWECRSCPYLGICPKGTSLFPAARILPEGSVASPQRTVSAPAPAGSIPSDALPIERSTTPNRKDTMDTKQPLSPKSVDRGTSRKRKVLNAQEQALEFDPRLAVLVVRLMSEDLRRWGPNRRTRLSRNEAWVHAVEMHSLLPAELRMDFPSAAELPPL